MAKTYYAQDEKPEPTMTVGDLIKHLQSFDPGEPVIFRSPQYGCFGSNQGYSIDIVTREAIPREERHTPARQYEEEETGALVKVEAHTDVLHAWSGVVIR